YAEVLAEVERARLDDQPLGQFEIYAPVAQLVGVGQRRACDRRADAHMIELAGLSPQTDLDIAQALAVGQLRESHDAKLLGATETARPVITAVTIYDAMESLPWQEIHDLREQGLAEVHGDSGVAKSRTLAQQAISNSSRGQPLGAKKSPSQLPFPATPLNLTGHYCLSIMIAPRWGFRACRAFVVASSAHGQCTIQ